MIINIKKRGIQPRCVFWSEATRVGIPSTLKATFTMIHNNCVRSMNNITIFCVLSCILQTASEFIAVLQDYMKQNHKRMTHYKWRKQIERKGWRYEK